MSDNEEQYDASAHKGLLQAISNLGKTQHIRKTTRSEPLPQPDEFQLVKGRTKAAPTNRVAVNDIVQVLRRTKDHLDAGKQLKNVQSTKKVLPKPLEKPAAQRIKRTLGYEKAKKQLRRWDAVVAKNRSAEQQIFPLPGETVFIDTSKYTKPVQLSVKSDLMIEMEAAEARLKAFRKERMGDNENEEELAQREQELLKKKLTRDELAARRREMAFMKMRESQKSAKARLKNKIKSKKYHKLLKKQKLQEQIKEFEMLQKTNPEAALDKLNELEKSRMLERANLRHKNTGAWAKNLQVRAKYDKDVRKELAEALQKSRELTLKKDVSDDVEDSEDNDDVEMKHSNMNMAEENVSNYDVFNPWTRANAANTKGNESKAEDENWRKYWLVRNEQEKALFEYKKDENIVKSEEESMAESTDDVPDNRSPAKAVPKKKKNKLKTKRKSEITRPTLKNTKIKEEGEITGWVVEEVNEADNKKNTKKPISSTKKLDIDDIFDEQEDKIQQKVAAKLDKLQKQAKRMDKAIKIDRERKKERKEKDELKNLKDLSFKTTSKRVIIDEELNNEELNEEQIRQNRKETSATTEKKEIQEATTSTANARSLKDENKTSTQNADTIDPTKVAEVKLKQYIKDLSILDDAMAEADFDDDEENPHEQRQMTISEAFEDDDIIADFNRDKAKDSELKNTEMQLSMPGWGSWAGAGLQQKTADSNKRFILNLAKKNAEEMAKRRDSNKNGVYINEDVSKHLRAHLVSDVPFPFTSAQEYEASIRAPIGRNCVTETAFRALTRPSVITKKGAIIEPMDESELIKPARRPRHVIDKRINAAQKAAQKLKAV